MLMYINLEEKIDNIFSFNNICVLSGDFKFIFIKSCNCEYFKKIEYKVVSLVPSREPALFFKGAISLSHNNEDIIYIGFENGLFYSLKIVISKEGIAPFEKSESTSDIAKSAGSRESTSDIEIIELDNFKLENRIDSMTFSSFTNNLYLLSKDTIYVFNSFGNLLQRYTSEKICDCFKIYNFENFLYLSDRNSKIIILDLNLEFIRIINDSFFFKILDFKVDGNKLYVCFERLVKVYLLENYSFNHNIYINETITAFDVNNDTLVLGTDNGLIKIFEGKNLSLLEDSLKGNKIDKINFDSVLHISCDGKYYIFD